MNQSNFKRGVEVSYLIPSKPHPKTGKLTPVFPNPSAYLRRFAFRIDGSVWMMDESRVPGRLFEDMAQAGATVNVIRYDESEREKILKRAKEVLELEVKRVRQSLEESLQEAEKKFEEAKRLEDADKTNETAKYVKVCFWRAKKLLVDAQEAAISFDILADSEELFRAVRDEIASRAEAYFALHAIKARKPKEEKAKEVPA